MQSGNIGIKFGYVALGLTFIVAVCVQSVPVRSNKTPPPARRGLRVRSNDDCAGLHEVTPILDGFWISFAYQKNHGRSIRNAVVRKSLLPVGCHQIAIVVECVDIGRETESNNVGLQPVDDGAGLFCRPPMRLLDGHLSTGFLLILLAKRLVELLVKLSCWIV